MIRSTSILTIFVILQAVSTPAQNPSEFLPDKPGKWSYSSNIKSAGPEHVAFNKNLATLAEWFHQNVSMLSNPKGFDLNAVAFGIWDDEYRLRKSNYGLRAELDFGFQLFLSAGGKWTVEPPHYEFEINNTESGHGGMLKEAKDGSLLQELFVVFPFVTEIAPGVHYYDCESRGCGSLVIFNPARPEYWLPVTVREIVNVKLKYYSENDKMLYDFIKPLVDKMSEEELNAPAFNQSDDGILRVNGKGDGLQFMRFNPDYWDRSLPPSAIQFMTFRFTEYNSIETEAKQQESVINNGHKNYSLLFNQHVDYKKLAEWLKSGL
jgi:hypothetical protein